MPGVGSRFALGFAGIVAAPTAFAAAGEEAAGGSDDDAAAFAAAADATSDGTCATSTGFWISTAVTGGASCAAASAADENPCAVPLDVIFGSTGAIGIVAGAT